MPDLPWKVKLRSGDHPLNSDPPDSYSKLNGLASVLVLALLLACLLAFFWFTNLTGNQDTTDYTPDPVS